MRALPVFLALSILNGQTSSGEAHDSDSAQKGKEVTLDPPALVLAIADLVLANHPDPPTRQEMVLAAARALLARAGIDMPEGLAGRISSLSKEEEIRELLAGQWARAVHDWAAAKEELESAMVEGLLAAVPGDGSLSTAKDQKLEDQFASNRYVGTGIMLGFDRREKLPQIKKVIENGPAQRSGFRERDLIATIDAKSTLGMSLEESISRLRGPEGSAVELTVRRPGEEGTLALKIVRGPVPLETVRYERIEGGAVGQASIGSISASAVHELRKIEERMKAEGVRGLVLDLRSSAGGDLHHAVLLADALLDGGPIGSVRSQRGIRKFEEGRDCLFRGLPMAVLVDGQTAGTSEWLAAALKDRGRAAIIGRRTSGDAFVVTALPIPGTERVLRLATGILERADGKPLLKPARPERALEQPIPKEGSDGPKTTWGVQPDHDVQDEKAALEQAIRSLELKGPP